MYPYIKRFLDLFVALIALCFLLPLSLPLLLLLRFTAEGKVFYKQSRIGQDQKPFLIWKFATMLQNSPNLGTGTLTLRQDPRVTGPGRFLRRSKLNELPQLINVLLGDMSLVGPRPLDEKAFLAYPETIRTQISRMKPGITGVGSIVFRDEEGMISASSMPPRDFYTQHIAPHKAALEIWYLKNNGFFTDLRLLGLTIWAILSPHNQYIYKIFPGLPKKPADLCLP